MGIVSGIYTGIDCLLYGPDQVDVVDELLELVIKSGNYNRVVSICMVPHNYFSGGTTQPKLTQKLFDFPTKLDGYTPRNKKLLSFPYCFFQVDSVNDVRNYKYELMADYGYNNTTQFRWMIYGVTSPNPEMLVCPYYYDEISAQELLGNPCVGVVVSDFPQCAFPIDSYRAWVAQKGTSFALSMIGNAAGVATNLVAGNYVGAALGAIGGFQALNDATIASSTNDHIKGTQSGSCTVGSGTKGIYFKYMSVTKESARCIDDFFDRYGYATERLKVPNRTARPHWCYTKTKNCAVKGNVPGMYARQIEGIYNNGITFWKNISEVGNYSLNNSV